LLQAWNKIYIVISVGNLLFLLYGNLCAKAKSFANGCWNNSIFSLIGSMGRLSDLFHQDGETK
jgi:hypothetical protein